MVPLPDPSLAIRNSSGGNEVAQTAGARSQLDFGNGPRSAFPDGLVMPRYGLTPVTVFLFWDATSTLR